MHIVKLCLPWAPDLWKKWSRLKATRGRYPASSNSVNKGKKIAIGGSITDTTQATVRYIPSTSAPSSHQGALAACRAPRRGSCQPISSLESSSDGTFAPTMVSHSTPASRSSIAGMPVALLVSRRSRARSRRWAFSSSSVTASRAISAA